MKKYIGIIAITAAALLTVAAGLWYHQIVKQNDKFEETQSEVKSESETKAPGRKASKNQKAIDTWIKNQSKWKAAKQLAESRGYKFVVISEKELENG